MVSKLEYQMEFLMEISIFGVFPARNSGFLFAYSVSYIPIHVLVWVGRWWVDLN